jgi:predicted protein tyrosine phosphatase
MMPMLFGCPLSQLDATVAAAGAGSVVTLLNAGIPVQRPRQIEAERHLIIPVSDIIEPLDGHILPGRSHVELLLAFAARWDRRAPLVVHCYAGVSRSTAAAFAIVCALSPDRDERTVAAALRAASPTATPNARLVAVADHILSRNGRMVAAIAAIGRGTDCFEATPFRLPLST